MDKRIFIELWNNDPIKVHNPNKELSKVKELLDIGEPNGSGSFDNTNPNNQSYQSSFIFYSKENNDG